MQNPFSNLPVPVNGQTRIDLYYTNKKISYGSPPTNLDTQGLYVIGSFASYSFECS